MYSILEMGRTHEIVHAAVWYTIAARGACIASRKLHVFLAFLSVLLIVSWFSPVGSLREKIDYIRVWPLLGEAAAIVAYARNSPSPQRYSFYSCCLSGLLLMLAAQSALCYTASRWRIVCLTELQKAIVYLMPSIATEGFFDAFKRKSAGAGAIILPFLCFIGTSGHSASLSVTRFTALCTLSVR